MIVVCMYFLNSQCAAGKQTYVLEPSLLTQNSLQQVEQPLNNKLRIVRLGEMARFTGNLRPVGSSQISELGKALIILSQTGFVCIAATLLERRTRARALQQRFTAFIRDFRPF